MNRIQFWIQAAQMPQNPWENQIHFLKSRTFSICGTYKTKSKVYFLPVSFYFKGEIFLRSDPDPYENDLDPKRSSELRVMTRPS